MSNPSAIIHKIYFGPSGQHSAINLNYSPFFPLSLTEFEQTNPQPGPMTNAASRIAVGFPAIPTATLPMNIPRPQMKPRREATGHSIIDGIHKSYDSSREGSSMMVDLANVSPYSVSPLSPSPLSPPASQIQGLTLKSASPSIHQQLSLQPPSQPVSTRKKVRKNPLLTARTIRTKQKTSSTRRPGADLPSSQNGKTPTATQVSNDATVCFLNLIDEFHTICQNPEPSVIEKFEQQINALRYLDLTKIDFTIKSKQSQSNILHALLNLAEHNTPNNLQDIKFRLTSNGFILINSCVLQKNIFPLIDFCNHQHNALMLLTKNSWPNYMLAECLKSEPIIPLKHILLTKIIANQCVDFGKVDLINDYLDSRYSNSYPFDCIKNNSKKHLAYSAVAIKETLEFNELNSAQILIYDLNQNLILKRTKSFELPESPTLTTKKPDANRRNISYGSLREYLSQQNNSQMLLERLESCLSNTMT